MPSIMMNQNQNHNHNFKTPTDITSKLAFQYCINPKTERPTPNQSEKYQFIIVEDWFCYPDFQNYYGPSNLAHVIRFCQIIEELFKENGKIVCVRSSPVSLQRSNVALLISLYLMLNCQLCISDICILMKEIYESVIDFRTEGEGLCDHKVSIRDCLFGFKMALNHLPSLQLASLNVEDLLLMEQPQNGDMNWIVPGKLLALAGPTAKNWTINAFIQYAKKHSIGCMVRLNREHYPAEEVTKSGSIEHLEMFMHDGTNPTAQNVRDFIKLVDRLNSKDLAVAIHCRAGLGRTGTMIAAYLIYQYARDHKNKKDHNIDCPCLRLSPTEVARSVIGYLRIMRPGSVLSGQPEFLENISCLLMQAGSANNPDYIDSFCNEVHSETEESSTRSESSQSSVESFIEDSEITTRFSKRIRLSSTSSASLSSENLKFKVKMIKKHPISQAGRGHAAEKHSCVKVEKLLAIDNLS